MINPTILKRQRNARKSKNKSKKLSFADLTERFIEHCQRTGKSPRTIRYYLESIQRFKSFLGNKKPLSQDDIEAYIDYLQTCPGINGRDRMSSVSINTYLVALKALYNFAERKKYGPNLCDGISLLSIKPRDFPTLEKAELQKVVNAARNTRQSRRDTAIVLLLISSGIRAGELISMQIGDIRLKDGTFLVSGKTGQRPVCLDNMTKKSIVSYLRYRSSSTSPEVFLTSEGHPLTYEGLRQIIRRLSKKTGIPLHAHLFRHSYATMTLRNGANVEVVRKLLGHKSLMTTMKYLHIDLNDLKQAQARYTPTNFLH